MTPRPRRGRPPRTPDGRPRTQLSTKVLAVTKRRMAERAGGIGKVGPMLDRWFAGTLPDQDLPLSAG